MKWILRNIFNANITFVPIHEHWSKMIQIRPKYITTFFYGCVFIVCMTCSSFKGFYISSIRCYICKKRQDKIWFRQISLQWCPMVAIALYFIYFVFLFLYFSLCLIRVFLFLTGFNLRTVKLKPITTYFGFWFNTSRDLI